MRILLVGYFGFGNLGDELLAETAAGLLKNHQVAVLSNRKKFWRELRHCDCLLFAGGSLFQDATGFGLSLIYYSLLGFAAKLFGKKLFLVSQGIGPLLRPFDKFVLRCLLAKADFISVRDADSGILLETLGCKNYHLSTDLLFCADIKSENKISIDIAVNLRLYGKFRPEQVIGIFEKFACRYIPMQNIDYGENMSREEIFASIAGAELAVGMRLHFLILAVLFDVPAIGIVYDPKVESFCRKFNLPFVQLNELAKLPDLIAQAGKNDLRQLVAAEKKLAEQNLIILREALNA